jgi:hypothetical protein
MDGRNGVFEINALTSQETQVEDKVESAALLQKLRLEEAALIEEKQNWLTLRESLQSRIKDEVELRKSNSEKLKSEIANLKQLCEAMTQSLNEGVLEK